MRRWSAFLAVLAALVLGGAGTALAEPPFRVGGAVEDRAGVLAPGDADRIGEATARLREANGTQLFVVFVEGFDGADGAAWADDTARLSQFGEDDALLAVAVGERAYGLSVDSPQTVSDGDITAARRAGEERLSANDWAGAAIAVADRLRGGGDGGLGIGAAVVGGVVVVGGGAYLLTRRRRTRPVAPAQAPAPPRDEFTDVATDDLAYRASAALLEVDEAVRTSEIELSAARGHFGDEAVAGFAAAVEASRADMLRAFGVRQQLDDDVPEDEPTRRAMCADIIRACRTADERLDAQVAAFDALRDLETRAPEYVGGLGTRRDAVTARVPAAEAVLAGLTGRYAPSALQPVAGNLDQVRHLLSAAGTEIAAATAELDEERTSAAVVSGRAAEDALSQAETLLDALPRREAELADAAARLPAARAEAEQDLAEARALGSLAPVVARAEAALAAAGETAGTDPIAALRLVDDAGAALDTALAEAKGARDRAAAVLAQTLVTARAAVAAAEDFVATRRGAVGAQARTRLAEAQRHLQLATSGGDPAAALGEAQQADARAQEALRLAQQDVSGWSAPRSSSGSSLGVDLGSLILGGIISGATRGGGYGGGFGGGRGGGFGGGGGRSPGSFGGSSSRGRRGGGGRF